MSDDEITSLKEGPEQTGLSLFCQIEKALQMESSSDESINQMDVNNKIINNSNRKNSNENIKLSNLAEEFPELFKLNSPLQQIEGNIIRTPTDLKSENIDKKIAQKLRFIKIQQEEIEQQKTWILQQLKIIEESRKIETDYKEKYEKLQKKYSDEKNKWSQERVLLTAKISELETLQKNNYSRGNTIDLTNTSNQLNNSILLINSNKINKNRKSKKSQSPHQKNSSKRSKSRSPSNSPHKKLSHNSPSAKFSRKSSPTPIKITDGTIPFSKIQKERVRDKIEKARMSENENKSKNMSDQIPNAFYALKKRHMFSIPVEEKYLNFQFKLPQPIEQEEKKDGRKILYFRDGSKAIKFRNNTIKATHGQSVFYFFANGDIGQEFHDGFKSYLYKETGTIEVTKSGQSKILVFKNGQREKHTTDGKKYVLYPNGQFEEIEVNGDFKMYYPDGKIEQKVNGEIVTTTE